MLLGRSCIFAQRKESTSTTLCFLFCIFSFLFEKICVVRFYGFLYSDIFLFCIIEIHHPLSIAQCLMYLFFLGHQFFDDSYIAAHTLILTSCDEIINRRYLLLSITVNTTIALIKCNQAPRNIIVEHAMTIVLQVDT